MCITVSKDTSGLITIAVGERFTFEAHVAFRESYQEEAKDIDYIIDLSHTHYMDSSALGMMLLLRDHNGTNKTIKVKACHLDIFKIFEVARFDKMFDFV